MGFCFKKKKKKKSGKQNQLQKIVFGIRADLSEKVDFEDKFLFSGIDIL